MFKKIEYYWRHFIVYPIFKIIFHNPKVEIPVDIKAIRKILFLRNDRIGDMIITTPIFSALKRYYPNIIIGVLASDGNSEIVKYNPNIDHLYILSKSLVHNWNVIRRAKRENYELVINFIFNRTTLGGLLSNIIAPKGIKIGQGAEKYGFYFNKLLKLDRSSAHMLETLASIIKDVLNVDLKKDELNYEIIVDKDNEQKMFNYFLNNGLKTRFESSKNGLLYIVFNLSATDSVRRISKEQAYEIGKYLGSIKCFRTVLIKAPNDNYMNSIKHRLIDEGKCISFPIVQSATLLDIASIIKGAVAVITPDTSIIHFASAMNTPVLGFYSSMQDVHEWMPHNIKYRVLKSERGQPTSTIPVSKMIQEIENFFKEIGVLSENQ